MWRYFCNPNRLYSKNEVNPWVWAICRPDSAPPFDPDSEVLWQMNSIGGKCFDDGEVIVRRINVTQTYYDESILQKTESGYQEVLSLPFEQMAAAKWKELSEGKSMVVPYYQVARVLDAYVRQMHFQKISPLTAENMSLTAIWNVLDDALEEDCLSYGVTANSHFPVESGGRLMSVSQDILPVIHQYAKSVYGDNVPDYQTRRKLRFDGVYEPTPGQPCPVW